MMKNLHINRRDFIKGVSALGLSTILPYSAQASTIKLDDIDFDSNILEKNNPQTIIIYMYGGASQLAGNLTNMEEINKDSQNPYPLDNTRYFKFTKDNFWENAGGDAMQRMVDSKDLNIFRTCYRTIDETKSHGTCTFQAQIGQPKMDGVGLISNLAYILYNKGAISKPNENSEVGEHFPFVSMDENSSFYLEDNLNIDGFLKPTNISPDSSNPYSWSGSTDWMLNRVINHDNNTTLRDMVEELAQENNKEELIKSFFEKRKVIKDFVDNINKIEPPSGVEYPENNQFGDMLKTTINLLSTNPYTKVATLSTPGLGGWDDHSNALDRYTPRMSQLMNAIEIGIKHIKALNKKNINIVVFSEFGRNVNYNSALGWDHGNLQNVYWFGGWDYFNHLGIVGETEIVSNGKGRIYQRPKNFGKSNESYHFQIFSVASTLYKLYGIKNPEILTSNNPVITGLLS